MSKKWAQAELDAFTARIADTLFEGFELRVAPATLGVDMHSRLEDIKPRVLCILRGIVDFDSDDFDSFHSVKRTIIKQGPDAIVRTLLNDINARSYERCRALRPEDWQGGAKPPPPVLTRAKQLAVHAKTLKDTKRIRAIWDAVLAPFETELDAADEVPAEAERLTAEARQAGLDVKRRARAAPTPLPQKYGVSARGAEFLVCDWMRHLGFLSATVTPHGSDGGIDVVSDTHVAQVKNYVGKVGVVEIRELFGTSGGYTVEALHTARRAEMPLFVYHAESGSLFGNNSHARALLDDGFAEAVTA
jgi:hypothetical protein